MGVLERLEISKNTRKIDGTDKGPFRSVNSEFFSNIARKKEKNTEIPKIISISSYRYENFSQIAKK